eukprot:2964990-Pleurochrysis_carterae.AAC.1
MHRARAPTLGAKRLKNRLSQNAMALNYDRKRSCALVPSFIRRASFSGRRRNSKRRISAGQRVQFCKAKPPHF